MNMPVRVLREAHRRAVELDPVLVDEVVIGGVVARKPDHPPAHHAAIAAIDRVAEEALDRALPEMREEHVGGDAAEIVAARLEFLQIAVLVGGAHFRKRGMRQLLVYRRERRSKQLRRRKGELISLAGCAGLPWPAAVEPLARAPGARQLLGAV